MFQRIKNIFQTNWLLPIQDQDSQQIPPLVDFLNGSASGVGNCLSGYLFDTLKVRMQLDPTSSSMITSFKNILKEQGFMNFFKGLYYPVMTVPLVNAIVFGSYQFYKKVKGKNQLSFYDGIQNGAFAGFVNTFVVAPVQLVKCRMQNDNKGKFKSSRHCLIEILIHEGIYGLYKGTMATVYRQVPAYAAQFAAYEYLKNYVLSKKSSQAQLNTFQSILIGGLAGLNCWIFSYPQDVIKTKLQVEVHSSGQQSKYKQDPFLKDGGFIQCGKQIYRTYGFKGFLKGISPCLIRAFAANAVGICIYEKAQQRYRTKYFST